jgi:Uma2 family endonuclease
MPVFCYASQWKAALFADTVMSQRAWKTVEEPTLDLVYDDGEPLDTNWHRLQIDRLLDVIWQAMAESGRQDFFAGGNMFVYFSLDQARSIAADPSPQNRQFRGPDIFFVGGVDGRCDRPYWVVWEEGGRYPDLIVELLSPSTARVDRTTKKDLYERTFRTPEYFLYDPEAETLEGYRLFDGSYQPLKPNAQGRLWSRELGLWLGRWRGVWTGLEADWLRLYDSDGRLIPTPEEAERERADAERRRAEAAEAEVARLQELLAERE